MIEHFDKYSDKEAYRIAYLIAGFIRETLTKNEHDELDEWVADSDENMQLFERLTDEVNIEEANRWLARRDAEAALARVKNRMTFSTEPYIKRMQRIIRYAVAASVIIAVGAWIYFFYIQKDDTVKPMADNIITDIQPGSDKATLTLENGKTIILDNTSNDTSINGQLRILQQEGEIKYSEGTNEGPMAYHVLTIPRKGQYKLVLPDGSKVWLNAASSIRYPVAFNSIERKVYVSGEAYFEVAKDKTKPFRVVANDMLVEALGTAFNINAYGDEPIVSATLVEGSILVTEGAAENVLKPGQQAKISGNEMTVVNVNADEVIAWKNNQFKFNDLPLDAILRQVARWYDAEIVYEQKTSDHFNAEVSRDVPVSKLLHILELTNRAHFKIEGNKIIVLP